MFMSHYATEVCKCPEFIVGFRRFGCGGSRLVFLFTFRLGILERIFPLYAQGILGQSWVLGVIVLVGLFVGSALIIKKQI